VSFGFRKMGKLQVFAVHSVTDSPQDATLFPQQKTERI
jgi:hypothetical protein